MKLKSIKSIKKLFQWDPKSIPEKLQNHGNPKSSHCLLIEPPKLQELPPGCDFHFFLSHFQA